MIEESARSTVCELLKSLIREAGLDLTFTSRPASSAPGASFSVEFHGADLPALLHHHGELLLAFEHIATQALRLSPEQHDEVSFDAGDFKGKRDRALRRMAAEAVTHTRASGRAFHFAAMNSRERRLLHLALADSGMLTASEGDPPNRHLVLHPRP